MHIISRTTSALHHLLKVSKYKFKCRPGTIAGFDLGFGRSSQDRCLNEDIRSRVTNLKPGDQLHGYTVQRVEDIQDFFMSAVLLTHDKTGAHHLHMARDDENNTFSVLFRTTPLDSTGVPHILEHTVLCGSQNFPVRDPFFKMISRSMATFMNAFTANDWTMYPFSSLNQQDFKNLMAVYLDAVFCPLIRELDFCQEGWRLEHTDLSDPSSPIIFKGVVYNEMKGVFSDSASIYQQKTLNAILPSHTYGFVSGGDPAHIPELTHQQLKHFHSSHYHPSNAKFFTYGNLPLEGHLEFINSYLDKFNKISTSTSVPLEARWDKPRTEIIHCAPDPMASDPEKQTTVSVSFLLSDITDTYENFVASIVGYLLTTGETSPFYRALLEPNIGSDYSSNTGYHAETKEAVFSVGLLNISPGDVDSTLRIIEETIDAVIKNGFDKKNIDALLHRIELEQKHQGSNFGLHLAVGMASIWNHDGDPVKSLQITKTVEKFKEELKKNPKMLQQKVQKYLKDNSHRLTLIMTPEDTYTEQRDQAEKERLHSFVQKLTEADKENILKRGQELEASQNKVEDVSCLPSLKISDLDPAVKREPVSFSEAGGSFIQTCDQPTNGVTYLRLASNLTGLSEDLMPYVPLFCEIITSIGAGGHDYLWMSQQQELYTGGMVAEPLVIPHHTDSARAQLAVLFASHCLERNFHKMLDLWSHTINSPDFMDMNRLATLIKMNASDLASSLSDDGHRYAVTSSASTLNTVSKLRELFFGYSQVRAMKQVAEMTDFADVAYKLQLIGDLVLDKSSLRISVNATPKAMDRSLQGIKTFLGNLKGEVEMTAIFPEVDAISPIPHKTQIELPFAVNHVALSFPAVQYTHKDYCPLLVLATLMTRKYLHREIREKGGAYGSGAQINSGVFSFFSYRDPHNVQTLDVFRQCIDWATRGDFTAVEVDEAKLEVFQKLDKPVPPGNRGQTRFIYDISDDLRQKNRDRLFKVTSEDLKRVSNTYLARDDVPAGAAFLGPAYESVKQDKSWQIVTEEQGKRAEVTQ